MNNNRTWEALSMKDRASFIKLAIQNGYRNLDSIRGLYNNSYAEGGPTKDSARLEYVMRESEGVDGAPYKAGSIRGMSKANKALYSDNIPTDRGKSNNNAYTGVVFTRSWNNPNYNPDVRDEFMLADANELKSVLGYEPVDFVDAYVYNKTPFRQLGVFEDKDSGEKRILRNSVKEGTNPKIYQTYPDTINKKTVRYLDKQLKNGIPNPGDNVRVIKSSKYPGLFNLEGTNLNYDGQKVSVVHVKQPDGKIAYKLVDLYDFAPDTWTTPMLLPKAKEGLQYIDENGNPYIMTSPWFYKEEWDKDIEGKYYKTNKFDIGGPENSTFVDWYNFNSTTPLLPSMPASYIEDSENSLKNLNSINSIIFEVTKDHAIQLYKDKVIQREGLPEKNDYNWNTFTDAKGMLGQCAGWVSKKYNNVTGRGKEHGVYGNAWNMLQNIVNSGGDMLFNIYDDKSFDYYKDGKYKSTTQLSSFRNNVNKHLANNNLPYNNLQPGDIVGIHINDSMSQNKAIRTGDTFNSHVGIVIGKNDNGTPIIEHNMGTGYPITQSLDEMPYKITAAARPKNNVATPKLSFDSNIKSKYKIKEDSDQSDFNNNNMKSYMDGLASAKETFKELFPEVDFDFIEKAAIGILKRETNFMTRKQSDLRNSNRLFDKDKWMAIARQQAYKLKNIPEELQSRDLSKFKLYALPKTYRLSIGLDNPEQLDNDPTVTARAVMLYMARAYDYYQRLLRDNPDLPLSKQDIEDYVISSYNTGVDYTPGFSRDSGAYDENELEFMRKKGHDPEYLEKNVNATNYKYLGKLGKILYNQFGDPHIPYVRAAREAMDNYIIEK